jgi:TnpA family transposase
MIAPTQFLGKGLSGEYQKQNWDDILRVAGSLKLGTVHVTDLLRALQGNGHPSTLAKAIAELGRIAGSLPSSPRVGRDRARGGTRTGC